MIHSPLFPKLVLWPYTRYYKRLYKWTEEYLPALEAMTPNKKKEKLSYPTNVFNRYITSSVEKVANMVYFIWRKGEVCTGI